MHTKLIKAKRSVCLSVVSLNRIGGRGAEGGVEGGGVWHVQ